MPPGLASADLFRMLGSFALVLAIMAALLWALRKLQSRMNSPNSGRRLNVIESLSVGPRQKFALLRVGQDRDVEALCGVMGKNPAKSDNETAVCNAKPLTAHGEPYTHAVRNCRSIGQFAGRDHNTFGSIR